jgi:hypothetical protein
MDAYRAESMAIMAILEHYTPFVEQVSVDEAYLDLSRTLTRALDWDEALRAALPLAALLAWIQWYQRHRLLPPSGRAVHDDVADAAWPIHLMWRLMWRLEWPVRAHWAQDSRWRRGTDRLPRPCPAREQRRSSGHAGCGRDERGVVVQSCSV